MHWVLFDRTRLYKAYIKDLVMYCVAINSSLNFG